MNSDKREYRYDSKIHLSDDELIDYLNGRPTDDRREDVQAHLVGCDECLEHFRDVRDFFEPHREGDQMITVDIRREWTTLWDRIGKEEVETKPESDSPRRRLRPYAVGFALAAVLLLALLLGLWAVQQRRENQRLIGQLEAAQQRSVQIEGERKEMAERLRQAEQEKLELQERERSEAQSQPPRRNDNEVRKPELNIPIYDLYARDFSRRSGNESEVNSIKAPATSNSMVLILNGEGLPASPSYRIEVIGNDGQVIWRGGGLTKGHLGNLTLTVERGLFSKGMYRLKLYSQNGRAAVAEYLVRVE